MDAGITIPTVSSSSPIVRIQRRRRVRAQDYSQSFVTVESATNYQHPMRDERINFDSTTPTSVKSGLREGIHISSSHCSFEFAKMTHSRIVREEGCSIGDLGPEKRPGSAFIIEYSTFTLHRSTSRRVLERISEYRSKRGRKRAQPPPEFENWTRAGVAIFPVREWHPRTDIFQSIVRRPVVAKKTLVVSKQQEMLRGSVRLIENQKPRKVAKTVELLSGRVNQAVYRSKRSLTEARPQDAVHSYRPRLRNSRDPGIGEIVLKRRDRSCGARAF
ncbi:hypothetical protein B0H19DRAFT_1082022 [Mycena capillaripes]|nr:hypothetical protein B0H19DRAFT_1082022 [Mycena capillaripes]